MICNEEEDWEHALIHRCLEVKGAELTIKLKEKWGNIESCKRFCQNNKREVHVITDNF